ncbi:MAG: hypothetical protein KGJ43_07385 [Acidobacteriota bacterium]|nr:hypothetical protein [Acidobacteriota bacterium]
MAPHPQWLVASVIPHAPSVWVALLAAFVLGVVHGVTPDEHTWPITFSYAVGSFSARRGMRAALAFSLAFTFQRALLSELAFLGLLALGPGTEWNAIIYAAVGAAMVLAGFFVLRLRCTVHAHLWPPRIAICRQEPGESGLRTRAPSARMAVVHGFIAGFGFGAFALVIVTVLAPAMPSAALGWAPGALFGLGTTVVLAGAGAAIGALIRRRRLSEELAQEVAQEGAGWTLLVGGALFGAAGLGGLIDPAILSSGISTGIHVYNLDRLGVPTALIAAVLAVAIVSMARALRRLSVGDRGSMAAGGGRRGGPGSDEGAMTGDVRGAA